MINGQAAYLHSQCYGGAVKFSILSVYDKLDQFLGCFEFFFFARHFHDILPSVIYTAGRPICVSRLLLTALKSLSVPQASHLNLPVAGNAATPVRCISASTAGLTSNFKKN